MCHGEGQARAHDCHGNSAKTLKKGKQDAAECELLDSDSYNHPRRPRKGDDRHMPDGYNKQGAGQYSDRKRPDSESANTQLIERNAGQAHSDQADHQQRAVPESGNHGSRSRPLTCEEIAQEGNRQQQDPQPGERSSLPAYSQHRAKRNRPS